MNMQVDGKGKDPNSYSSEIMQNYGALDISMMDVKLLRIITGEEVVAEVLEWTGEC